MAVLRSTDPDRDAVACSQGDVIPDLIDRLMAADDLDRSEPLAAAKGSAWALTFAEDRLVNLEYFPPPRPVECTASA